jgi:hypothetical protein
MKDWSRSSLWMLLGRAVEHSTPHSGPESLSAQGEAYPWVAQLPVRALTLDFCGVPGATAPNATLDLIRANGWPADKRLGVGCVDGRSVWADDEGGSLHAHAPCLWWFGPALHLHDV